MPGLPVHHQLPELTQTSPLSQWCHPTNSSSVIPFFSLLQSFPASGSFQMSQLFASSGQYWSFSFNISPSNEPSELISFGMDWLDLLAVQETLKSLLQHHSSKTSVLRCSASPTLTSIHDYWKNHSLDYMDLCWQSNVSAKRKSRLKWGITSHWSELPSSKNLQTVNAGEGVEKRDPSPTVGGNANWYSHYGEQYGGSLRN